MPEYASKERSNRCLTCRVQDPECHGVVEFDPAGDFDLNRITLSKTICLWRPWAGHGWLDIGTFDSLLEAGQFTAILRPPQGLKAGRSKEVAHLQNWIGAHQLDRPGAPPYKNGYGLYLKRILKETMY